MLITYVNEAKLAINNNSLAELVWQLQILDLTEWPMAEMVSAETGTEILWGE